PVLVGLVLGLAAAGRDLHAELRAGAAAAGLGVEIAVLGPARSARLGGLPLALLGVVALAVAAAPPSPPPPPAAATPPRAPPPRPRRRRSAPSGRPSRPARAARRPPACPPCGPPACRR